MIFDQVGNLKRYPSVPYREDIVAYLANTDVQNLPEGDVPINGDDLYVKILRYVPKKAEDNLFEIHDTYTDVQVVFDGTELIQAVHPDILTERKDAEIEGDFRFYDASGEISDIVVCGGQFVVFFPGEPHRPGCLYGDFGKTVTKLVFKVKSFG